MLWLGLWRKGSFGTNRIGGRRFAERRLPVGATDRDQRRALLDFLVATCEAPLQGGRAPSPLPARLGQVNGYKPC
jgi:hypothetical protein